MKIKRNPIVGVLLGIGFMALGVIPITHPEWFGRTPSDESFFVFWSAIAFIAGLAQILYIVAERWRNAHVPQNNILLGTFNTVEYAKQNL